MGYPPANFSDTTNIRFRSMVHTGQTEKLKKTELK